MTRAAVVIAGAILVCVAWALCREQQRVAASFREWDEPDDGIPADPYLTALVAARSGDLQAAHIRDMALAASEGRIGYWY